MSDYQLRLYRGLPGNIPWRIHVDSISLEADNDTVAREKARTTEIWPLDNSDTAVLYDDGGHVVEYWRLHHA